MTTVYTPRDLEAAGTYTGHLLYLTQLNPSGPQSISRFIKAKFDSLHTCMDDALANTLFNEAPRCQLYKHVTECRACRKVGSDVYEHLRNVFFRNNTDIFTFEITLHPSWLFPLLHFLKMNTEPTYVSVFMQGLINGVYFDDRNLDYEIFEKPCTCTVGLKQLQPLGCTTPGCCYIHGNHGADLSLMNECFGGQLHELERRGDYKPMSQRHINVLSQLVRSKKKLAYIMSLELKLRDFMARSHSEDVIRLTKDLVKMDITVKEIKRECEAEQYNSAKARSELKQANLLHKCKEFEFNKNKLRNEGALNDLKSAQALLLQKNGEFQNSKRLAEDQLRESVKALKSAELLQKQTEELQKQTEEKLQKDINVCKTAGTRNLQQLEVYRSKLEECSKCLDSDITSEDKVRFFERVMKEKDTVFMFSQFSTDKYSEYDGEGSDSSSGLAPAKKVVPPKNMFFFADGVKDDLSDCDDYCDDYDYKPWG